MFIDEIPIFVKGGRGGDGIVSFFPGLKSGPDGGNGGIGGSVYIELAPHLHSLSHFVPKRLYEAESGKRGGNFQKAGRNGQDLTLQVPRGTTIIDTVSNIKLGEILPESPRTLVARGGLGGRGNDTFKTATYRAPRHAEAGKNGEEKSIRLILKLIADYGFIGLPNVGKSNLLNELTRAQVKTANYPFTTLEPNLGVCNNKVIADIPGLIEGAHTGKGLGIKFLKHIEKVKMLFHCISADSQDPLNDYQTVVNELKAFNSTLSEKNEIILLSRHDLVNEKELKKQIHTLKKLKRDILPISIHDWDALEKLKKLIV